MSDKPNIIELAIAAWRLEKWLDNLQYERKMAAKSALRTIKKYIADSHADVVDPIGSKFDPGLSIEVISNESECFDEENLIVIETITPYVYFEGALVQSARVIIGDNAKTTAADNDVDSIVGLCNEETTTMVDDGANENEVSDNKLPCAESDSNDGDKDELDISADEIERVIAYAKIL